MIDKDLRIVFMGTPEFAVASLSKLVDNGYNIVGVITSADKPAGRGKKIKYSAVKEYALNHDLRLLQPTNLKDPGFVDELRSLNAHLQIVVAFRMLPEVVWSMPPKGTFNLHASLLPQYRGAAPINHAIINGETITGLTTFFLDKEIDTGRIIKQREIKISETENAGTLHDRMMVIGGDLVVETVNEIIIDKVNPVPQELKIEKHNKLKSAPKIFKEDCRIDWNSSVEQVYNFIRGLSPYPAAYTELRNKIGDTLILKIYKAKREFAEHNNIIGSLVKDNNFLKIAGKDGYIIIEELQQSGKKRMPVSDFLRGFKWQDSYKII
ncbi:MAG: methionyl-tRNA formyltransferase [Marinilabiliales bacterium]|nr:MAG: methionyl-tRNA formyltransferase [Marinilabiliales bacterium]